jgi:16S rRNA processing protein RimM
VATEPFIGVTLAKILRARGLRGEVAAQILTDFPERLPELREVWLTDERVEPRHMRVQRCWLSTSRGGQAIFLFSGIDNVESAEKLRGLEIQIPLDQRTKLNTGNYYVSDLVGCEVWEVGAPAGLGIVLDVQFPGGPPLLSVETEKGEVLIPLAAAFCVRIDIPAQRIDVSLPEGLLDLNRG